MYHPPASRERLSHWNNSPASSALITCMAGSTLADSQAWQGIGASGANTLEAGVVPDRQVPGERIPQPRAALRSPSAQALYPPNSLV